MGDRTVISPLTDPLHTRRLLLLRMWARISGFVRRNACLSFNLRSNGLHMGLDANAILDKASLALTVGGRRSGFRRLGAGGMYRGQHSESGDVKQLLGHAILRFGGPTNSGNLYQVQL